MEKYYINGDMVEGTEEQAMDVAEILHGKSFNVEYSADADILNEYEHIYNQGNLDFNDAFLEACETVAE